MLKFFKKPSEVDAKLHEVLQDYELPSFPRTTTEVLRLLRDPGATSSQIAVAVQHDPGLSMKLLKTVNSVAYAPRRPIASVDQAVVILGNASLEQTVMALAVRHGLPKPVCDGYNHDRFWTAAACRAAIARALAQRLHPATAGECFSAALLEDMAVPVLALRRSREYGPLLSQWLGDGEPLVQLEQQAFGWDHAEIGTCMARHWGLPDQLATAVAGHHSPEDESCPPAVYLAGLVRDVDSDHEELIEEAHSRYDLAKDDVVSILDDGAAVAGDLASLLT